MASNTDVLQTGRVVVFMLCGLAAVLTLLASQEGDGRSGGASASR